MKGLTITLGCAFLALAVWPRDLLAEFTLILKNGRRFVVESYREEGGIVKFRGLGGEIGIAKDQIQSIIKGNVTGQPSLSLSGQEASPSPTPNVNTAETKSAANGKEAKEKLQSPEEKLAEERAKEEKEYRNKVEQATNQIKALQDRYALATRGSASPAPSLLDTEAGIKARTDDLTSRLRDQQYNPQGPPDAGGVKLLTPSPFTALPPETIDLKPGGVVPGVYSPPPPYTEKERDLSDLRKQIDQLINERDKLIQEMQQKKFDTGSLFLQ